jgi:hypothetical protein
MKKFLGAISIVAASLSGTLSANEAEDLEVTAEEGMDDVAENDAQYNIWVCAAVERPTYYYSRTQIHFGASEVFPAGSGYGQQARVQAYREAMRQCGGTRWSRPNCTVECYVHRFQL